jgi:hypothetical protein|tara:strand:- start:383 stop:499 length:117 start_codon:yes stop_codon:yes gene_type:complete
MNINYGLGMLSVGMIAILVGGIIAWYIINKVVENDEEK